MPRRPRRITRDLLHIAVTEPRWFDGRRLANLVVTIDDPTGLRRMELCVDRDAIPNAVFAQLQSFCGGVKWRDEIKAALATIPKEPTPCTMCNGDMEVVWSGTLEAKGHVPGLATSIGSTWPLIVAALQEPEVQPRVVSEAQRQAIKDGRQRSAERTEEQCDEKILSLLRKGYSYMFIAEALDVSPWVVQRVARQAGMRRRRARGEGQ